MVARYTPAGETPMRGRMLKELRKRKPNARNITFSRKDANALATRMFSFEPLAPLTRKEKRVLQQQAADYIYSDSSDAYNAARQLLRGTGKLAMHWKLPLAPASREETLKVFNDVEAYENARIYTRRGKGSLTGSIQGHALRGVGRYPRPRVDGLVRNVIARKGKARVLDLGCSSCMILHELKREFGRRVETHGVSLNDSPRHPVTQWHLLDAAHLPRSFKRKFDVVASNETLYLHPLPHLVLRNAAECLAPGGKAIMQWSVPYPMELTKELQALHAAMPTTLSQGAAKLLAEGVKKLEKPLEPKKQAENWEITREVAVLNELAELRNRGFTVKVTRWEQTGYLPNLPYWMLIERPLTNPATKR